ncbi:hypothetical protein BE20_21695 [Sorangium cellulosum]|nr:hypothetical protein BE20_21695 [Sorangium cellulosum]
MLPGRLLDDRFELAEVAGSGGMGTVYRALDRATGEVVAIKLLRRLDARAEARFLREAAALSRLSHPHIVRYVTHGVAPTGEPYLAMEWLSGESLADRLSRQELRVDESVALARKVADALGAAHASCTATSSRATSWSTARSMGSSCSTSGSRCSRTPRRA